MTDEPIRPGKVDCTTWKTNQLKGSPRFLFSVEVKHTYLSPCIANNNIVSASKQGGKVKEAGAVVVLFGFVLLLPLSSSALPPYSFLPSFLPRAWIHSMEMYLRLSKPNTSYSTQSKCTYVRSLGLLVAEHKIAIDGIQRKERKRRRDYYSESDTLH